MESEFRDVDALCSRCDPLIGFRLRCSAWRARVCDSSNSNNPEPRAMHVSVCAIALISGFYFGEITVSSVARSYLKRAENSQDENSHFECFI